MLLVWRGVRAGKARSGMASVGSDSRVSKLLKCISEAMLRVERAMIAEAASISLVRDASSGRLACSFNHVEPEKFDRPLGLLGIAHTGQRTSRGTARLRTATQTVADDSRSAALFTTNRRSAWHCIVRTEQVIDDSGIVHAEGELELGSVVPADDA